MSQPEDAAAGAGLSRPVLDALQRWLVKQALMAAPVPKVAAGFAEGLIEAGLPLWRAHLTVSALDPEMEGVGLTWTRGGERLRDEYGHGSFGRLTQDSPIYDAVLRAREDRPDRCHG